jgi:predicted phosphodiesterase
VKQYEPVHLTAERKPSGRPFRLVAFASDIHVPEHDAFAVRAWLAWVQHAQPDVIVLGGDILELESCSGHGGNIHSAPLFTHEVECGNKFLDDVQAAAPDAEIVYLEGNHETRLGRKVDAHIPTMTGALDLPSLLRLDERGIEWLPYGRVKRFGSSKLGFTHGLRANDHHAKAHLALYGSSIVYGHTHRPQTYVQGYGDNKVRAGIGAPCLRSLDVSWIKGPTGWAQGFVIAHLFEDGHFTFYPVLMDRQRFVEGGRLYDGRA